MTTDIAVQTSSKSSVSNGRQPSVCPRQWPPLDPGDETYKETLEVARDSLAYALNKPGSPALAPAKTMRRMVEKCLKKHEILFNSMITRLRVTEPQAYVAFVAIADEVFGDGKINWGRVVAVHAFVVRLARELLGSGTPEPFLETTLADYLGRYMADHLGGWIKSQGGWAHFVEHFRDESELESKLLTGLVITGVGLGLLAGVRMAMR